MFDTSTDHATMRARRLPWQAVLAAAAALALLTAVAAGDPGPSPAAPPTTADDDSLYRRLVNEGHIPDAGDDEASDVTRRLINEGQIPRGALE